MSLDLTDTKWTLIQVMALCQCWPSSMSPYGVNRPQWVSRNKIITGSLLSIAVLTLRWRHNGRDCVSNHQPHDCLLNSLFGRRSKKTSKFRVSGLCVGNSPETGEFPAQMASNADFFFHLMTSSWTHCDLMMPCGYKSRATLAQAMGWIIELLAASHWKYYHLYSQISFAKRSIEQFIKFLSLATPTHFGKLS